MLTKTMDDSILIPAHPVTNFYNISTITAVANINTFVTLNALYECLTLDEKFVFVRLSRSEKGESIRRRKRPPKYGSALVENQVTIVLSHNGYHVNAKVFRTGMVQITGARTIRDGYDCIMALVEKIKINAQGSSACDDIVGIHMSNFRVCLINTDFRAPYKISCRAMYEFLTRAKMSVTYDPNVYSGVVIRFHSNKTQGNFGICKCDRLCKGKGDGETTCKKITVSVFHSGCIIITGAVSYEQVHHVYEYLCNLLLKNREVFCTNTATSSSETTISPEGHASSAGVQTH